MIQTQDSLTEIKPGVLTLTNWNPPVTNGSGQSSNCVDYGSSSYGLYWGNYPVYVTTDKTAKAIAIIKALTEEKHLDIKSVPKFIAMVEKITGLL